MTANDIIEGDVLMVFINTGTPASPSYKSVGGSTSHTLTLSPEYSDISCKDAGLWGWKKLKKVSWEVQSENLYVEDEYVKLLENTKEDTSFKVVFGASDWDNDGLDTKTEWTPDTSSTMLYTGEVKISSLTLNAQSGEVATYSVTFTGNGPLSKYTPANNSQSDND